MNEPNPFVQPRFSVFVVDDDPAIRDSTSLLLSLRGYTTAQFASAEDFLGALDPACVGCVLADIRMPGMSGLQLQAELAARGVQLPVIIITGHGDVSSARTAFRNKAVDFLEKPYDEAHLIGAIEAAFAHERERLGKLAATAQRETVLSSLSPREREVVGWLSKGLHAREIGERLGISHRTVEVHKAHIMEKMGVRSVIDIMRLREGITD